MSGCYAPEDSPHAQRPPAPRVGECPEKSSWPRPKGAHQVNCQAGGDRRRGWAGVGTKSKKGPWVWPVEKSLTAIEGSSGRTNNLRYGQRAGSPSAKQARSATGLISCWKGSLMRCRTPVLVGHPFCRYAAKPSACGRTTLSALRTPAHRPAIAGHEGRVHRRTVGLRHERLGKVVLSSIRSVKNSTICSSAKSARLHFEALGNRSGPGAR